MNAVRREGKLPRGVRRRRDGFAAFVWVEGKHIQVGVWAEPRDAAVARDRACLHFGLEVPLNDPRRSRKLGPAPPEELRPQARARHKARTSSRFLGVSYRSDLSRYVAFVRSHGGDIVTLGTWTDEHDAAIARDRAVLHLGLDAPLNLPKASRRLGGAAPEQLRRQAHARAKATRSSRFVGVSRQEGRFVAHLGLDGRVIYLGTWYSERQAALARDRAVLHFGVGCALNFAREAERRGPASPREIRRLARLHGKSHHGTSRYLGVCWDSKSDRWLATIPIGKGRHLQIGRYDVEEDAAVARDRVALDRFGDEARLNFPEQGLPPASVAAIRREIAARRKARTSSRFRGVTRIAVESQPWSASIRVRGREMRLGSWPSEQRAALAHDRAALFFRRRRRELNFPEQADKLEPTAPRRLRIESSRLLKATKTSRCRGVFWHKATGRWLASIEYRGRRIYLGLYDDEDEAGRAYDEAAGYLCGEKAKLNFDPITHEELYAVPRRARERAPGVGSTQPASRKRVRGRNG